MSPIIFVGGDCRQARGVARLRRAGALADLEVRFHHPTSWCRNWKRCLQDVDRQIRGAQALVITTDVPTELGKSLRDLARAHEVPWHSVNARGQAAILRALHKAAGLAAV